MPTFAAAAPPMAAATSLASGAILAANLQRLMAARQLGLAETAALTGLNVRTLRSILKGRRRPHPRTLGRLAAGLQASLVDLLCEPRAAEAMAFDRGTNPAVDMLLDEQPERFAGWTAPELAELYSHRGHGGDLTSEGARHYADRIARKREVLRQTSVLLETAEAELLALIVAKLYERIAVR